MKTKAQSNGSKSLQSSQVRGHGKIAGVLNISVGADSYDKNSTRSRNKDFALIRIDGIKIGRRFRKDLGDIASLAKDISEIDLLQPVVVNETEELQKYLDLASKETFETLHHKVEAVYKKYVNAEEYYIVILAADTIYSYFQDRFGTTHYNIFVGDNGSGKNSALLVYRYLGYRVFYVTAASAANYYTFMGDTEEGQGTTAEDEADDIGYDRDKQKIFKTGYCFGGFVPKVDLPNGGGRRQDSWLTYCHKWMAIESLPDHKKIKGILDRPFVYNFVAGDVPHNIKDVIKYAGDPEVKPLYDELVHIRKLLFAFRMEHYNNVIPDIKLNIKHRNRIN